MVFLRYCCSFILTKSIKKVFVLTGCKGSEKYHDVKERVS